MTVGVSFRETYEEEYTACVNRFWVKWGVR